MEVNITKRNPHDLQDRLIQLEKLNLDPVRLILRQAAPTGLGWSEDTALQVEVLYRQFLHINLLRATERPVPNTLVDAFWHAHILATRKYRADCERVFGYFLDHDPGFGAHGDADDRDQAFVETTKAQEKIFGKIATPSMCGSSKPLVSQEPFKTPSMCGSSIETANADRL